MWRLRPRLDRERLGTLIVERRRQGSMGYNSQAATVNHLGGSQAGSKFSAWALRALYRTAEPSETRGAIAFMLNGDALKPEAVEWRDVAYLPHP